MRAYTSIEQALRGIFPEIRGGIGYIFDLANLLAASQSVAPQNSTGAATINGSGVDSIIAEAILWTVDLGALTGGTLSLTATVQDSNDNGVTDAFANAQDYLGNAIATAALTVGSQLVVLAERGNRELNANSNFRPSRRFRRMQVVTTGTYAGLPLAVNALVVKRRLPSAQAGPGN
jgi:hypothetical protein